MPTPGVSFELKRDGYALLSLDHLELIQPSKAKKSSGPGFTVPPRNTPFFDQDVSTKGGERQKDLHRTWYIFFEQLIKRLSNSSDALLAIRFFAPSIDEEDMGWWGEGALDGTSGLVRDFGATIHGESRYAGVTFSEGDYIVWANPNNVNDTLYHEIDQIVTTGDGGWTLKRRPDNAPAGQAHFGSYIASQSGKFYRLAPRYFTEPVLYDPTTGEPKLKLVQFPWANKCVAAIRSWGVSAAGLSEPFTLNLGFQNECPGWRTMNGAAYTSLGIAGNLSVNQRAAYRVRVQAWESIRCTYGSIKTPSAGASIRVAVVYIAPGDVEADRTVGLIEKFTINADSYCSFSVADPPDGRQMPYTVTYPPNLLPNCGALGDLTAPVSGNPSLTPVLFAPDGEIELVVEQIGASTAGADLTVTVQT